MFRLIVLTCVIAACSAQTDPKLAKILKEQRFNAGDGRAGSAFATEDGKIFKEEISIDGSRIGQYSYTNPDGTTFTVKYKAGKDGFQILEGSHVPQAADGFQSAPFAPLVVEEEAPIQRVAQPRPRFQQQQQQQLQPQPPQFQNFQDFNAQPEQFQAPVQKEDPNRNPFINPHDPTHRNFQFNENAANFDPRNPLAGKRLVPNCANCEGVNPFVNPFDQSHAQQAQLDGHFSGRNVVPRANPLPVPPPQPKLAPSLRNPPPVIPKNFFPPGQLKLNRFESGFNFDFSS